MRSVSLAFVSSFVIALSAMPKVASADSIHTYRGKAPGVVAKSAEAVRLIVRSFEPRAPIGELMVVREEAFAGGETIVGLEQIHNGIPVVGRGAAVQLNRAGENIQTHIRVDASLPSSRPSVTAEHAARAAASFTKFGVTENDAHLIYFPVLGESRLVWAVLPQLPFGFASQPRILVDAQTGSVIEARDLVQFANGKSYPFNPISSPTVGTFPFAINPEGSTLSNPFVISQNCIDQKSVKPVSGFGINLSVHLCDLVQKAAPNGAGDYLFDPIDDASNAASRSDEFSEVTMYYHVTKAYQFFRTLQGDANAQVVSDKPLRTISNLQIPHGLMAGDIASAANPNIPLDPFQNAFFSPAGGQLGSIFSQLYGFNAGAMWFGQGPVHDYSYDGDVVYHEFSHAVVDKALKLGAWHIDSQGSIDSAGAMNEGLADYFSSAITGDPKVGEYASKDIDPNYDSIRTLDNTDKCLTTITGELHYDSTFFSGGLWSVRAALGAGDRPKFDAAIYKAMRMNPGSTDLGYDEMVKLFLDQLATDFPAGKTALEKEMTARGILPTCDRTFVYGKEPIKAPSGLMATGSFAAPSAASLGIGSKQTAPGMIQVKLDLPENPKKVTVTFDAKAATGAGAQASSVLGGGGKFAPLLLAKFDGPIVWTTSGTIASDADLSLEGEAKGTSTATFDVPKGAKSIYVQIANAGDADGAYDNITMSVEASKPKTTKPKTDEAGTDDSASNAAAAAAPSDSGGCSTTNPRGSHGGIGILVALALVLLRRGRRS